MTLPAHITDSIAHHLDQIGRFFKNPKITLVVRAPDLADGDLVMTADNLDDAIAAIQRLQARQAKAGAA